MWGPPSDWRTSGWVPQDLLALHIKDSLIRNSMKYYYKMCSRYASVTLRTRAVEQNMLICFGCRLGYINYDHNVES